MPRGSDRRLVWFGGFAALLAVGVGGCSVEPSKTTSVEAPLVAGITDDAIRAVAGCPDCTVLARSTVTLPLTGKVFTEVKLASAAMKVAPAAALDGQGNAVDPQALLAAEGRARMARQGKLRDDAYARSLTSSSELVPISIWADFGDGHAPREQIISNSTLRAAHQAQTASRLRAPTSKVTSWLDARGFRTYDRGTDSPLITADVPSSALSELGRLDGAAIVHLRYPEVPYGTAWFDAVKGPAALAVVGSVGLPFCNGEGWQPDDYTYLTPYQIFDSTAPTFWHTTWTTELISATASTRMAPGASPYLSSWNSATNNMFSAWSWCYSQNIHNMNRSAGIGYGPLGLGADDMAQDYYAYHWPYPLITEAAGNCWNETEQLIPCSYGTNVRDVYVGNRAYNALIVGASNGNTTPQTSDDFLAGFSQYKNPVTTHHDHELPNLVAPGDDTSGYTGTGVSSASYSGAGTSASAPITLGTVLLMKQTDYNFNYWPEMTRATILTASTHPVDGARTVRLSNATDLKQGAGLLNAAVAVALADPLIHVSGPNNPGTSAGRDSRYFNFSTDFPNSKSAPYNIVTWTTGRLRVVAAWDATAQNCNPDGSGCSGDMLDGDLDLWVSKYVNGSWQLVGTSTTYDSSWELCDIAVNAGDIYKAELRKYVTNSAGTYVGIAWNNYNPNVE